VYMGGSVAWHAEWPQDEGKLPKRHGWFLGGAVWPGGSTAAPVLDWGREEEEEGRELWWTSAHKNCYLHLPTPAYSPCFSSSAV